MIGSKFLSPKIWIVAACVLGGLGVIMGAFGSHAIPKYLDNYEPGLTAEEKVDKENAFEIGVRYQIYHALALFALGILALYQDHAAYRAAGVLMVVGSLCFSGGLYLVALTEVPRFVHLIVPLGGSILILGWLAMIPGGLALRDRPVTQ